MQNDENNPGFFKNWFHCEHEQLWQWYLLQKLQIFFEEKLFKRIFYKFEAEDSFQYYPQKFNPLEWARTEEEQIKRKEQRL